MGVMLMSPENCGMLAKTWARAVTEAHMVATKQRMASTTEALFNLVSPGGIVASMGRIDWKRCFPRHASAIIRKGHSPGDVSTVVRGCYEREKHGRSRAFRVSRRRSGRVSLEKDA